MWRRPEFSGDFQIASDGSITHPLYRELKVAGLPFGVVETRVREFLARYEANPAFVLSPLLRIVVGGEVRQPNVYSVPPGTTIAQAVALAGGTTERGRLDRVRLIREGRESLLDLNLASSETLSLEMHSGDQVMVTRKASFFRDVAAPASSVVAALASLTAIIVQLTR